jgi:parvulin-like peptidyl-prolyl isomerase
LAKKQKKPEFKQPPTKRQLSKWQRQRRIQRITIVVCSFFFAFIIGYIGYGYYAEQVKPLRQPVVRVNNTVFDMGYYIKMLELYSQGQESSKVSLMADVVAGIIEQGELIRQGAADLGISVSTEEINSELGNLNLPNDKVYRDAMGAELLAAKLLKEYFDPKVPTACEQVHVQAMLLESKEVAKEVIDRLGASDNFTSLATEFSKEAVTKEKGGDLGWLPKGFTNVLLGLGDSQLEDIAFSLEPGMLSEPTYDGSVTKGIGYWLAEVLEEDVNRGSHVRGILLGSQQEAEEVKAKIEAGEDFGVLAQEYSQHLGSKELNGDLGWTKEEIVSRVVDALATQLKPGVLSEPTPDESVQTKGGYWLVKVLDKDANRQLEDKTRETLKSKAFEDWVNKQREKDSVERYLSEEQKSWAVARVIKNKGQ